MIKIIEYLINKKFGFTFLEEIIINLLILIFFLILLYLIVSVKDFCNYETKD